MDLWQLRYFAAAAETLNFTKAAESLHVSQSALSKKIADIENHFGVQLFLRGKRALRLTAAGQVFLNEARTILAKWDDAFQKIKRTASGDLGDLRIGYSGSFVTRILPPLIRQFRGRNSDINLHVERWNLPILHDALLDGDLDVAFVISHAPELSPDLAWKFIKKEVLSVVLPASHPLAGRKRISLSELTGEAFVFMARSVNHIFFDFFMHLCTDAGFTPNLVSQPAILETVLLLVDAGVGITILSPLADMGTRPNLRMIPLEGDYPVHLFAAWKMDNENSAIPAFIEELEKIDQTRRERLTTA